MPFVFVRVRGPEHFERLLARLGPLSHELDGIVLPKVTVPSAAHFFAIMRHAQRDRDRPLWAMPILEGPDTAHRERRLDTLLGLKDLLAAYRDLVPCVRIGATDLSGLWGLRRSRDFTVYDLAAVADVIADVVNVFGRSDGAPAISGPVWEYIHDEPVFKPRLRETPFTEAFGADGADKRAALLSTAIDGLLREALLDRVNGLHGKTVIHPSHIAPVDAVYAVSHSEHQDALAILSAGGGAGVEGPDRRGADERAQAAPAVGGADAAARGGLRGPARGALVPRAGPVQVVSAPVLEGTAGDLLAVGERAAGTRSFLLVSKVLGKHIPVPAAVCRASGTALGFAVAGEPARRGARRRRRRRRCWTTRRSTAGATAPCSASPRPRRGSPTRSPRRSTARGCRTPRAIRTARARSASTSRTRTRATSGCARCPTSCPTGRW